MSRLRLGALCVGTIECLVTLPPSVSQSRGEGANTVDQLSGGDRARRFHVHESTWATEGGDVRALQG